MDLKQRIRDLKPILKKIPILRDIFGRHSHSTSATGLRLRVVHNKNHRLILEMDDKPHNLYYHIASPAKSVEWQSKFGSKFSIYWYVKPGRKAKSRKRQLKEFGRGYFDIYNDDRGYTHTRLSDLELGAPDYMASILPHDFSIIRRDLKYLGSMNIGKTIHIKVSRDRINRYQKQIENLKKGLN